MDPRVDPETTPKPFEFTKNADSGDRTPYIPRRKSSVGRRHDSGFQDMLATMPLEPLQKPSRVWPKRRSPNNRTREHRQESRLSRASLSKMHPSANVYHSAFAQSHHGLSCPDRSSMSSVESKSRGRLLSRIMSSFTHNDDSTRTIPAVAKSFGAGHGQVPRLSGSTARDASSRAGSMISTESSETSLVLADQSGVPFVDNPNSPNPLRAPPPDLMGQQSRSEHLSVDQGCLEVSSQPGQTPPPALATATLHSVSDVTDADLEKAATVWIAVDVECGIHYTEDPTSTPRSKALGPPYTDPGS